MTNPALLATRYARRPLLLEPGAAMTLLQHLQAQDPRGLMREGRFEAALRKIGVLGRRPNAQASEAPDVQAEANPVRPTAYAPLWAQQAYGEPTDEGFAWSMFQGVACMEINSAIGERGEYYCGEWYHGYDTILAGMREALADERVKALFVRDSSPGGVVAGGIESLASFMREARAASGGKPIHVFADMACSAAYWIAAQADFISAPRVGLVGSIGACIIHEDLSGAYEKYGLKVTAIQFGDGKTDGASWKPLSASAREDLQSEIDQCGEDFLAAVSAGRPQLTREAMLATQARVFMANNADAARSGLALGLVDAIETEEQAFARILAKVSTAQGAAPATPAQSPAPAPASAATAPKEKTMAVSATQTSASAALATRRAELEAELSRITAEEGAAASAPEAAASGEGEEGDEAGGADQGAGEGDGEGGGEGEGGKKPDAQAEANAILASPEAQAHPHAAMAAARTGMTLAQFKAQVEAAGQAPQRGLLGQVLASTKRLGPDGAAPSANAFGSALVADAKSRGGR